MEVITQLSRMFQPDVRMIKKQIESLIDREYLERDPVRGVFKGLGDVMSSFAFLHPVCSFRALCFRPGATPLGRILFFS